MSVECSITEDINSNAILLYMKGQPGNSNCSYSTRLVTILKHFNLAFSTRDVLESEELRNGIKAHTNSRTLPLLFVNGDYVGGSDDIREMHEAGTLVKFFEGYGIPIAVDPSKEPLIVGDVSREQIIKCSKAS